MQPTDYLRITFIVEESSEYTSVLETLLLLRRRQPIKWRRIQYRKIPHQLLLFRVRQGTSQGRGPYLEERGICQIAMKHRQIWTQRIQGSRLSRLCTQDGGKDIRIITSAFPPKRQKVTR